MWHVKWVDGRPVTPRKYRCGKTQDELSEEIVDAFSKGAKRVVFQAAPGTGKSVIALNSYYELYGKQGKCVVVVPTRSLQLQYAEDYGGGKFVIGDLDNPLSIGFIWGRRNFQCPFRKCNAEDAPCVTELRYASIVDKMYACPFYNKPLPRQTFEKMLDVLGRDELEELVTYKSVTGQEVVCYRRKHGSCPYYEQFIQYATKDVIVLNDKMWFFEKKLGRVVAYDFEILDEFDTILLSHLPQINMSIESLSALVNYVKGYEPQDFTEEVRKRELLYKLASVKNRFRRVKTKDDLLNLIYELLQVKLDYAEFFEEVDEEVEAVLKKFEYVLELLTRFYHAYEFVRFGSKISLICIEPKDYYNATLFRYSRKMLLMSATPLDRRILKDMFGIDPDAWIVGEVKVPGICYLGGTFTMDVSGRQFIESMKYRQRYAEELYRTVIKARLEVEPRLGIITAYKYVEALRRFKQLFVPIDEDGTLLERFRRGEVDEVWTTRAFRGIDLPHAHGLIVTKYPYPDLNNVFWRVLREKRPRLFKLLYKWIAEVNLFQMICRELRDDSCWCVVYSPDVKVKEKILEFAKQGYLEVKLWQVDLLSLYEKIFVEGQVVVDYNTYRKFLKVNPLLPQLVEVVDVGDGKVLIKVRSEYVQETTQQQQQQATREAHVVENSIVKTQVKFVFYKKWQQYKPLQVVEIPRDLAEKLQSEGYGEIVQE